MLVLYPLRSGSQVLFSISFESRVRVQVTSPSLQSQSAVSSRADSLFANTEWVACHSGSPAILACAVSLALPLVCGFARPDSGGGLVCAARWYRLARYRARSCSCVCSFVCSSLARVVRCASSAARFVRSCWYLSTLRGAGRKNRRNLFDSRAGSCALVCGALRCAGLDGRASSAGASSEHHTSSAGGLVCGRCAARSCALVCGLRAGAGLDGRAGALSSHTREHTSPNSSEPARWYSGRARAVQS